MKKSLWLGTQLLVLESKVFFVLDCFGVTGKLQEYIQWTKTLVEIS